MTTSKPLSLLTIQALQEFVRWHSTVDKVNSAFAQVQIPAQEGISQQVKSERVNALNCYLNQELYGDKEYIDKLLQAVELLIDESGEKSQKLREAFKKNGWTFVDGNFRQATVPHDVETLIASMNDGNPIDTIKREWERAISSLVNDPPDSLTASSSMIEATYKFILHDMGKLPPDKQTMQELSKVVLPLLGMSRDQVANENYRAIVQATITIANSVGSIRTKEGDAHGSSPSRENPLARHARFSINTAYAVCTYILEIYSNKKEKQADQATPL